MRKGEIMEEKTFPIYRFYGSWDQVGYENNFVSFTELFKEDCSEEDLNNMLKEFKEATEKKHDVIRWLSCNYEFVENETWCPGWFSHTTYNKFESEAEAFRSFENYVRRKLDSANREVDEGCMMGAEDRYRWEICDCSGCKQRGLTAINH